MAGHGGAELYESDERLLERVRSGEVARFAVLVQRYNRSLYRVARSIVRDDHEAEDIVQQTHVAAFAHLHQFEGRAKFSTWLARIAAHEALSRRRQQRRVGALHDEAAAHAPGGAHETPEDLASRGELARAIEAAIDALPPAHRTAFVLRHVEGLDTAEAAAWLGVSETNLRVLVHRACRELRSRILDHVRGSADEVFSFGGERCARVTRNVLQLISRVESCSA
jgi:RNA polymerase sigma-70 factor (ECF subfamily)